MVLLNMLLPPVTKFAGKGGGGGLNEEAGKGVSWLEFIIT